MEKYKEYITNKTDESIAVFRDWLYDDEENYSGRRKTAIFLIGIGVELSAEIYKYIRIDEIETLTFEIARIDGIPFDKIKEVIKELYWHI